MTGMRDHGGGLDDALATYGGNAGDWLDLSTGINPCSYPVPAFSQRDWNTLPDRAAHSALLSAARDFWDVPAGAEILAAPGASSLISRIPQLQQPKDVYIPSPTYNEHAAAFEVAGWSVKDQTASAVVLVHPNNPDGRLWTANQVDGFSASLVVIDESFADVMPQASLVALSERPGVIILKSFGKFWGLAGLRLGFAIARPDTIEQLRQMLGPWPVSGPALRVGAAALSDNAWAETTRRRLEKDAKRLDEMMIGAGAEVVGGCDLFRLYKVKDATAAQTKLATQHIWSRIFPYSGQWLRLGLPGTSTSWSHLEKALEGGV